MSSSWFESSRIAVLAVAIVAGLGVGLGAFTFLYAKGASYLTNDPAACKNCHVMNEQFDGWVKSSHRAVASCNDCHAPHSLGPKLWTKAKNGFRHSLMFTTGRFHEPIGITDANRKVTEGACRHCHESLVRQMDGSHGGQDATACLHCHRSVGHLH
jgi:cytochrome c nitrite reductase small subunit